MDVGARLGFDGPLAEFGALRSEIELRAKHQNQIVIFQLTMNGAVFSFALTRPSLLLSVLIVPFSSYLLCGRYAAAHRAITRIARYIRDDLSDKVPGGLGWEQKTRTEPRRGRFFGWLVPFMLAFPGASAVALGWTSHIPRSVRANGQNDFYLLGIWSVGVLATCISIYLLLRIYFRRR